MKSQIQFGLAVSGFLYFALILFQGLVRYQDVTAHLGWLGDASSGMASVVLPTEKLSQEDSLGIFRRCVSLYERSVANVGENVALQFQTIQAAAAEQVLHSSVGAGLFFLLGLTSWRQRGVDQRTSVRAELS